ncbi:MAG: hypothetical protein WAY38_09645, partial [Gemmiger qucibialis]
RGRLEKCMVCEGDCFFESKQCNKAHPAGRCKHRPLQIAGGVALASAFLQNKSAEFGTKYPA